MSMYVCESDLCGLSLCFFHPRTLIAPMRSPKSNVSKNVKTVDMVISVLHLFENSTNTTQIEELC